MNSILVYVGHELVQGMLPWFWAGPDAYTAADKVDALNATAGYIWQMGALDFAGGTVVHTFGC